MKNKILQHSKKLTLLAFAMYAVVSILTMAAVCFLYLPVEYLDALVSIHGGMATLCGVVITGYLGNSSVEKYSLAKYQFATTENANEEENG